jgi:uncharacterized protein YndB with AHSA1/START domain
VSEPDISVRERVDRPADAVWLAVSDPSRFTQWSPEASGASVAGPLSTGTPFTGSNRNGVFRWTTSCVVVESVPGVAFAFDVSFLGLAVSTWRYHLTPTDEGCEVVEQWWDRRGTVMKTIGALGTGVSDRAEHNRRTMTQTLAALKADLEGQAV